MPQRVQYKVLVESVYSAPETVTVDRWLGYEPTQIPPARRLPIAAYPTLAEPLSELSIERWIDAFQPPHPAQLFTARRPAVVEAIVGSVEPLLGALTPMPDRWLGYQPERIPPAKRLPAECQGWICSSFIAPLSPQTFGIAQWASCQPLLPAAPRRPIPFSGITGVVAPLSELSIERWIGAFSGPPVFSRPRLPIECQSGTVIAPPGALSASPIALQWAFAFPSAPPGRTLPAAATPALFGPTTFPVPIASIASWLPIAPDRVSSRPRLPVECQIASAEPFDTIAILGWRGYQSPQIIAGNRLPIETQIASVEPLAGVLDRSPITVAQWQFQLPIAPPRRTLPAGALQFFVAPISLAGESISLDRWQGSTPQILFPAKRLPAGILSSIVAPPIGALSGAPITVAQWLFQLPTAPPGRRLPAAASQFLIAPVFPAAGTPAGTIHYPVIAIASPIFGQPPVWIFAPIV